MKVAVFASLLSAAAAFAPASQEGRYGTAVNAKAKSTGGFDASNELGVIAPTGFWDPLKLSANIDQETFDRYRLLEIKHGRISQLACLGYVTQELCRFPGDISPGLKFSDVPNGLAALTAIPSLGWAQIIFLIGAVDYWGFLGSYESGIPNLEPAELEKRKLQEIQHGRIAMLGILELLHHDYINMQLPLDEKLPLITGFPWAPFNQV